MEIVQTTTVVMVMGTSTLEMVSEEMFCRVC